MGCIAAMTERDIFVAAREIADPGEREAYLARACTEAGQRERLEALLKAEPGLGAFLEVPACATEAIGIEERPAR